MASIKEIETFLGGKLTAVIFTFLGALLKDLWSKFRGRRIALSWTVNFQRLMPQGAEPFFPKIHVMLDGKPCQNLYSCNITIRNETSQDVDDFDLLFSFADSFHVLYGQGSILTSAKNLLPSKNFLHTVKILKELPEEQRTGHISYRCIIGREDSMFSVTALSHIFNPFLRSCGIPNAERE